MSGSSRKSRWRKLKWPPLLIHSISPQSRARLFAARSALASMTIPRHESTPLSSNPPPDLQQPSRRGCIPPVSYDCTRLQVTMRWVRHCFFPVYTHARHYFGPNIDAIVDGIFRTEASHCFSAPTPAATEFARRVQLAAAILLRDEGIDVSMPFRPNFPPPSTPPVSERWVKALLTGWP